VELIDIKEIIQKMKQIKSKKSASFCLFFGHFVTIFRLEVTGKEKVLRLEAGRKR
jgi:hypothetical protein